MSNEGYKPEEQEGSESNDDLRRYREIRQWLARKETGESKEPDRWKVEELLGHVLTVGKDETFSEAAWRAMKIKADELKEGLGEEAKKIDVIVATNKQAMQRSKHDRWSRNARRMVSVF